MGTEYEIVRGYTPGIIWRVSQMHESYYTECGFDHVFECRFGNVLAEFIPRIKKPFNEIWRAIQNGRVIGFIALDSENLGNGDAHLRWFIVDKSYRDSDISRSLLVAANEFCDAQNIETTQIWIYNDHKAAQKLLESVGFALTKEWEGYSWGKPIIKQQFTRSRTQLE